MGKKAQGRPASRTLPSHPLLDLTRCCHYLVEGDAKLAQSWASEKVQDEARTEMESIAEEALLSLARLLGLLRHSQKYPTLKD